MWFECNRPSDHSPGFLCIGSNNKKTPQQLRAKAEWCRHPAYQAGLDDLCKVIRLEALNQDEQLVTTVEPQRVAVRSSFCQGLHSDNDSGSHFGILTMLSSIAGCVWARDLRLYNILSRHSSLAFEHLPLENGVPTCL